MIADQPNRPSSASPATRNAVIGGVLVVLLSVGWFVLSHFAMGTGTTDAVGEALGVLLGLLILGSAIGALASARENKGRST